MFALWAIPLGWLLINATARIPLIHSLIAPGQILVAVLILGGCFEYIRILSRMYPHNAFWVVFIWLGGQTACDIFAVAIPFTCSIFILFVIVLGEAVLMCEKNAGWWKRTSLSFCGILFLYIAGSSLCHLYAEPFQAMFTKYSHWYISQIGIIIVVTSVFFCDTGAYFVGSLWGCHKLSKISPNKTGEGTAGGFVVALLTCVICWHFFGIHPYPSFSGVFLGVMCGIGAIGGDISVSVIKRYFQVKDSSNIIPGHGGILDRFGSLFFAAPCIEIAVWILNKMV